MKLEELPICPSCSRRSVIGYRREHAAQGTGYWGDCQCGMVFQPAPELDSGVFDSAYYKTIYQDDDHCAERFETGARTYLPVIEELLCGQRTLLDVGHGMPHFMEAARVRGWTAYGVDRSPHAKRGNLPDGVFQTADFMEMKRDRYYDLLWCSHVLETVRDHRAAFRKAYDMLTEPGVLFLATPDAGEVNRTGLKDFIHWRPKECAWMFRADALCREIERAGFRVLACFQQDHSRFTHPQAIHLIAKKG